MTTNRRIAIGMLASIGLLPACRLFSQDSSQQGSPGQPPEVTDKDIDLLRQNVRSQKKQIIAANLTLTDKEAEQFWPIYDQYTNELVKINDQKYAAIKEYANSLDTMTDDQALKLTKQALSVDQSVAELRLKYVPIFTKAIPGKKTATFMQLDRRLVMIIDLQVASIIPLVTS
jgi:hypothetical protein